MVPRTLADYKLTNKEYEIVIKLAEVLINRPIGLVGSCNKSLSKYVGIDPSNFSKYIKVLKLKGVLETATGYKFSKEFINIAKNE